jgi:hypothetical protein
VNYLGVVAHPCNLSTQEDEAGGCEFKASVGYIERPYLKKQTDKKTYKNSLLFSNKENEEFASGNC